MGLNVANKILYFGDTAIDQAGAYLSGIMAHCGIEFEYVASDAAMDTDLLSEDVAGIILSDYPAENISEEAFCKIVELVQNGVGLLMLGGWESYVGQNGGYQKTVLRDVLPVSMMDGDDRLNMSVPCLIKKECEHEILGDLPFDEKSTLVGGFNEIAAKEDALTVLSVQSFDAKFIEGEFVFEKANKYPLLVTGKYGRGNVAAFASDVAPHWVGGFVDWGKERVVSQANGSIEIEVGSEYVSFFENLIRWMSNL